MEKKLYLNWFYEAARQYKENLLNKNILFVGRNNTDGKYCSLEVGFLPRNFMHLLGVKARSTTSSITFFEACLSKRLSIDDFSLPHEKEQKDYFLPFEENTKLKLEVITAAMKIQYTARMIGDYNYNGNILYTEKLAGNVRSCMGFVEDERVPYYLPNTILKDDIRAKSFPTYQVLATYMKKLSDKLYSPCPCYIAKNFRNKELRYPDDISCKISLLSDIVR